MECPLCAVMGSAHNFWLLLPLGPASRRGPRATGRVHAETRGAEIGFVAGCGQTEAQPPPGNSTWRSPPFLCYFRQWKTLVRTGDDSRLLIQNTACPVSGQRLSIPEKFSGRPFRSCNCALSERTRVVSETVIGRQAGVRYFSLDDVGPALQEYG